MPVATITATAAVAASATTGLAGQLPSAGIEPSGTIQSIVESIVPSMVASVLPSAATTTAPVSAAPIFLPVGFEVTAIFAGALAGGLVGVRKGFDVIGVITLAIVTGLGGGIIRDVLLQDYGVFALETPRALIAALLGAGIAMFFLKAATKLRPVLSGVDALSLALFCLVGADKALVAKLTVIPAIMLGSITSIGGGILRDILCDTEPEVLRRGSLYSTVAIVGSAAYVGMVTWLNITKPIAMLVAASIAVALRLGSVWFGWESPEPIDLTDSVTRVPLGAWRRSQDFFRRGKR